MEIKRIIDLSQPFVTSGYNNPAFQDGKIKVCMDHENQGWHAETITTPTHVGTHIDAPLHKLADGNAIDQYPLTRFIGEAVIIDLYDKNPDDEITLENLSPYDELLIPGINVLLCTGWTEKKEAKTKYEYLHHSPWLGELAAKYLVSKKVNAVGIDHFSIGGTNPRNVTTPHNILLSADILILEDLLLPRVLLEKRIWTIIALPILMAGTSGSMARIVAIE